MQNLNEFVWIENDQEFTKLCNEFSRKKWLTLDTEFIRETTYYAIPGLLQFSDGNKNWLVDPLGIKDWSHFSELLESDLIWVMHACNEDLEVLHQLTSTTPNVLFDTQVAAHFIGMGQSLGYQKLIDELCQVFLEKGESRTNWLKRPLSDKQLHYATDDVHYLAMGWQDLQQQLIQKEVYDFFQEDMQKLSNWQAVNTEQIYKKVKLSWTVDTQLEVNRLQAVAKWREQTAQLKDRPKRRILDDETLIAISKQNPRSLNDFIKMNILNSRQVSAIGKPLLSAIQEEDKSSQNFPIVRRSLEVPGSKQLIKKWKNRANEIAEANQLPPSILFTNGLLDAVFKYNTQLSKELPKMWSGWRENLLNDAFLEIMQQQDMLQSDA